MWKFKIGKYKIEIEQAMRYGHLEAIQRLENIKSIGISIRQQID